MTRRRLTTGVTLVVLVIVCCGMAVWGYRAATAPIADSSAGPTTAGPTCQSQDQKVTKYVKRGDVTVSVYNSGKKSGRAQQTADLLEQAGFRPGEVKNAPEGVKTDRAAVYSAKADDPAAELVALALGKSTQVVHSDQEFGPGVAVVIGDKFRHLDPNAPKRLKLPQPEVECQ
jgi:hypothetical protein